MGVSLVGLFILLLIMGLPIAYVLVAVAVAGIMAMARSMRCQSQLPVSSR